MTTSRIDALRQLLDSDLNDATTHYMLGHEYFKAQKHADAASALRRYLQLADDEGQPTASWRDRRNTSATSRGYGKRTGTALRLRRGTAIKR